MIDRDSIHPPPGTNCACPLCVPEKYYIPTESDKTDSQSGFTITWPPVVQYSWCNHCYCQLDKSVNGVPHNRCCKCGDVRASIVFNYPWGGSS
jgi:hypothetical protein